MQEKFRPGVFCRGKLSCVFAAMVFCLALVCASAEGGNRFLGEPEGFPEPVVPEGSFGSDGSLVLRVRILEERVAELASRAGGRFEGCPYDGPLPGAAGSGSVSVPGISCPVSGVVFPPWVAVFLSGPCGYGRFPGSGSFSGFHPFFLPGMPGRFGAD